MIHFKVWYKSLKSETQGGTIRCRYQGWFLFGIIPLYTVQIEFPKES